MKTMPATEIDPEEAVRLAERLLTASLRALRRAERLQAEQLSRMMEDASGKAFTFAIADEIFRPPSPARRARVFRDLLSRYGVPEYLSIFARAAMQLGSFAARLFPKVVMPLVEARFRSESSAVILPAEHGRLSKHIRRRKRGGMELILNRLGEAVLGEGEAGKRLQAYLEQLAAADCEAISVKLSAIYSQIHPVAREETLGEVKSRLREFYRAALRHRCADGSAKFVNLDMEEYRDLSLTCAAFTEVLSEQEFMKLEAGIVLQAYLPDAWPMQQALHEWAGKRVAGGGAGIRIRIVKGANLAMETVEAEWHGWPLAPYGSKCEVDANFKRMLQEALRPENAGAVRSGVASHNLFDIAYALLLREKHSAHDRMHFEMLEGMVNHQARTLRDEAGGLLLYAPVVKADDFPNAIAYLIRRLEENTSPENFLHDLFGMKPGDDAWQRQKERFIDACRAIPNTRFGPARQQDRSTENPAPDSLDETFANTPNTDFSLDHNVTWIREIVARGKDAAPAEVPLQIGGSHRDGFNKGRTHDPSRPGVVVCHHALAGEAEVDEALEIAVKARTSWKARPPAERAHALLAVAARLAAIRGAAIATMVREAGKTVTEADVEVTEAIDFANYYARSLMDPGWSDGSTSDPVGPVVVTPPWNFPFAIPCGGVLAPLAAGTSVILKPAPQTVLTAWVMAGALWEAGIPRDVLQFLPCPDDEVGRKLVTDDRVGAVVLTGASDTARMFLSWKPDMHLLAETSGKNAMIITAAADPDLAVKDLVHSAFGHAGQKCSAASLAILEAEIYDDPGFRRRLLDAAASLKVGSSWDFASVVTPLIQPPGEELRRALTTLDPGEEWLLEPRQADGHPNLWSPGIKLGVMPDSWFRHTECFGPVLGLIRADDLEHAIDIQNDSAFALTGGIHSLDPAEVRQWQERVEVGNAYINRPITGAIVQRQPFGGWKRSCYGPGAKAGGPNYVAMFAHWRDEGRPQRRLPVSNAVAACLGADPSPQLMAAAESDAYWMKHEFSREHDPAGLRCEANLFRYRARGRVLLRAPDQEQLHRMMLAALASGRCHEEIDLSLTPEEPAAAWMSGLRVIRESDTELAGRLQPHSYGVLRVIDAPEAVLRTAHEHGLRLIREAPLSNGRVELHRYFHEQGVSKTLHRHGALVAGQQDR